MELNQSTKSSLTNAKQSSSNNFQPSQKLCGSTIDLFLPTHSPQCSYYRLTCSHCGKKFWRRAGQERERIRKKSKGPFCSNSCQSKARTNRSGGNYKLTPEVVSKIRACDRAGIKMKVLCETFGMSKSGIYDIITYRKWKDVADTDGIRRNSRPFIQRDK